MQLLMPLKKKGDNLHNPRTLAAQVEAAVVRSRLYLSVLTPPVVTTMDNIIQETIQYTRQRKIFKQPVLYHQAVHFRLAELQTEVELLRSLLHRATGGVTL